MFEDNRLRVFVTVADSSSFSEASRALGVSQPAVSQNIAALESAMGETLVIRSYGKVELTAAGKIFYDYASRILSLYEHLDAVLVRKTETPAEPVLLSLDSSREAEVSVSDGEIHIRLK